MSVSLHRRNSVAKETSRCSKKPWRRANVIWMLRAGYEKLCVGSGICQWVDATDAMTFGLISNVNLYKF